MSKYVTEKSLDQDQLQALLTKLLADNVIPESSPLTNIIRTYEEYINNPDKEFISKVYDLELGKVIDAPIERFNFALDYVCVMKESNEIYFLLDNSKIVCVYDYHKHLTAFDVYLTLTSYLDEFNVEVFMADDTSELEEYVGCKVAV